MRLQQQNETKERKNEKKRESNKNITKQKWHVLSLFSASA